ncbi:MAG: hypothetical protein ACRDFA_09200 [bacterium]
MGLALLEPRTHELRITQAWRSTWSSIGLVAVGMARQGYDLQLTKYEEQSWRANFYPSGVAHSVVTWSGWTRTPWGATQAAAWKALMKSEEAT